MTKNMQLIKILVMEIIVKMEVIEELYKIPENCGSSLQHELSSAKTSMQSILEMLDN